MAEAENFEDDLFADLYDDNDASKTAPTASSGGQAQSAPAPEPKATEVNGNLNYASGDSATATAPANPYQGGQGVDDDDDDDEVDFNLGGGSSGGMNTSASHNVYSEDPISPPSQGAFQKSSAKEDGKMFIGGLNWETTDESLGNYFSQFGEVTECTVMRDNATGRSRGFGFLTFKDPKTVNIVMVKEHFLDGKIIDPKRAIPRDEQEKTSKIFVGGVSQETTDQEFKEYFAQFGRVVDATLMMDKDTGRPRGFGFVTFESEAGVDACINVPLEIHGKPIEVKKAQPRGNLREEDESRGRMKFQRGNEQAASQGGMGQGAMAGNNANSMTPQMMAQYFQRMNQYFAMMQSQMAMRGMQMNPGQMQNMMQMQQMQNMMGRGGPGGQNMMNPQMMQQMQQQMQQQQQMMQQQQQQQQGGGDGNGAYENYGGGGGGAGGARGGFQQQQRGGRRGGYGGGNGDPQGGAYNGGGGGGGAGGYGGQQSYEGMYDDVPQGGGQNAPPANAPTGPKNAGKPGANYRGGGRGGNRGFHPYAR